MSSPLRPTNPSLRPRRRRNPAGKDACRCTTPDASGELVMPQTGAPLGCLEYALDFAEKEVASLCTTDEGGRGCGSSSAVVSHRGCFAGSKNNNDPELHSHVAVSTLVNQDCATSNGKDAMVKLRSVRCCKHTVVVVVVVWTCGFSLRADACTELGGGQPADNPSQKNTPPNAKCCHSSFTGCSSAQLLQQQLRRTELIAREDVFADETCRWDASTQVSPRVKPTTRNNSQHAMLSRCATNHSHKQK